MDAVPSELLRVSRMELRNYAGWGGLSGDPQWDNKGAGRDFGVGWGGWGRCRGGGGGFAVAKMTKAVVPQLLRRRGLQLTPRREEEQKRRKKKEKKSKRQKWQRK